MNIAEEYRCPLTGDAPDPRFVEPCAACGKAIPIGPHHHAERKACSNACRQMLYRLRASMRPAPRTDD